jgi:hypothetical protein
MRYDLVLSGLRGEPISEEQLAETGEPALLFSTTSNYDLIWWGQKMHGECRSVRVYRPAPESAWSIISDTAVFESNPPIGAAIVVREANPEHDNPILKAPDGYGQLWNDRGTGGTYNGSIWQPLAPDGYVPIGSVANGQNANPSGNGYEVPVIPNLVCVRFDMCEVAQATVEIWDDEGSHHDGDTALWQLDGVPNAFVAGTTYGHYNSTAYRPKALRAETARAAE